MNTDNADSAPPAARPLVIADSSLVDLNTASREVLLTLPRITGKLADALIAYRSTTAIVKLWQLTNIPGFGPVIVRGLQGAVCACVDAPAYGQGRRLRCALPLLSRHGAGCITVASWNIQRLSLSKADFALHVIAAVARSVDILAVQEIIDVRVLEKLLMLLPEWRGVVSPSQGKTSAYTEQYAYLWNDATVRLTVAGAAQPQLLATGACHTLSRPPFIATFTCVATSQTLRCANFHAVCGNSAQARARECEAVHAAVDASPIDVLLGDFNTACADGGWRAWQGWTAALPVHTPTTLAGNPWDHVWVRDAAARTIAAGVYDYRPQVLQLHPTFPAQAVSDHLPIYTTLALSSSRTATQSEGTPDARIVRPQPCDYQLIAASKVWYAAAVEYGRYAETSSRILC